jgi:hypothetical protein
MAKAFIPSGVAGSSVDEPDFEPVITPEREVVRKGGDEEIDFPDEEEIRRELEREDAAGKDGGAPTDAELAQLRAERAKAGFPASNGYDRASVGKQESGLPRIPVHQDIAGIVTQESARNALERLQSTRGLLETQLQGLQRYMSEGGVATRLHERARSLEVRSSDPVWLVIEAALDSAFRITSGLEIFSESLGVYLEYEFTKVQLYDALLTKLEAASEENDGLRVELGQMRVIGEGVQRQLLAIEGNQYEALKGLPDFAVKVSAEFNKALESAHRLAERTERARKELGGLGAWVKAAVVVGLLGVLVCCVVGWLVIGRLGLF